ncbi:hypothetical protein K438DRAFT_1755471 [Mycena galopus ATCC 62051]|nr:hypothetical protein K438DRAFT_1755471 [Mycena galopus ATCC 62051]
MAGLFFFAFGFFFGGGTTSASEVSEAPSDLRFVDRVLRPGTARESGNFLSEGGAMGVGEEGNSRGHDSDWEREEDTGLDAGRGTFKPSCFFRSRAASSGVFLGIHLWLSEAMHIES